VALKNVPDEMLGEAILPSVLDKLVEFSGEFVESFDDADLSVIAPTVREKVLQLNMNHFAHTHRGNENGGFDFLSHPEASFKHHMHHNRKGFSLPKISSFCSANDHEIIMAKHQVRQDALGEDVCQPKYEITDWEGNCNELFHCVSDMTPNDLLTLNADGYLDTTPGSQTIGELTVHPNDLNLYDMDHDIRGKLEHVKGLATKHNVCTFSSCV
jgi:hypothetical protein